MEPFSLVCKSCAARLKVTKPSAIGQILACPKCGTMIEVAHPQGWTPPVPAKPSNSDDSLPEHSHTQSTGDSQGHFDDIDSILATPKPTASKRPSHPADKMTAEIHTKRSQHAAQQKKQLQPPPTGPVLPTDQWTSDSTKKRKRIAIMVIGAVGSIVLIAVIVTAFMLNRDKQSARTSQPEGSSPTSDTNAPEDTPSATDPPPNTDLLKENTPELDSTPVPLDKPPEIGKTPPEIPSIESPTDDPQKPMSGQPSDPDTIPVDDATTQEKTDSPFSPNSPFLPGSDPEKNSGATSPHTTDSPTTPSRPEAIDTGVTSKLGDLASLLEQSGTSIRDIQDAAVARQTRRIVGIPKYIVKHPAQQKIDIARNLNLPIGGMKYDSPTPLVNIIRNLSAISGIPMTIDVNSIVMAGKNPNPEIKIEVSGSDVEGALTQILTVAGLSKSLRANGLIIGVEKTPGLSESTFDIPVVPGLDEKDRQQLVVVIKTLINPDSWRRKQNQPTLKLVGNQIIANCSQDSKKQIGNFLAKLAAAATLVQSPEDPDALTAIQSRWSSASPNLAKHPGLSHSVHSNTRSFLDQCFSATGVTLLMDWDHTMDEGWSPLTIIPGKINEPSLEQVLKELGQSMNLVALAVDDKTIVMTTHRHADSAVDLEFYSVSKLLAGPLNEQTMNDLIRQTLGAQLQTEKVRFTYEPNFQTLIVSAPQSLQRQLDALIKQLESL